MNTAASASWDAAITAMVSARGVRRGRTITHVHAMGNSTHGSLGSESRGRKPGAVARGTRSAVHVYTLYGAGIRRTIQMAETTTASVIAASTASQGCVRSTRATTPRPTPRTNGTIGTLGTRCQYVCALTGVNASPLTTPHHAPYTARPSSGENATGRAVARGRASLRHHIATSGGTRVTP